MSANKHRICESLEQVLANIPVFHKNKEQIEISSEYSKFIEQDLDKIQEYGINLGYLQISFKRVQSKTIIKFIKFNFIVIPTNRFFDWSYKQHLISYIIVFCCCALITFTLKYSWVSIVPVFWILYGFAQYSIRAHLSFLKINQKLLIDHFKRIEQKHRTFIWNQFGIIVSNYSLWKYRKDFFNFSPLIKELMRKHFLFYSLTFLSFFLNFILIMLVLK